MSQEAEVVIRRGVAADWPVVRALAERTWRVAYADILSGAQIDYMLAERYTDAALEAAVGSGRMVIELVGRGEGDGVGFVAHGQGRRLEDYQLHQVYVDPKEQGRGWGRWLIEHVEEVARRKGKEWLVLTVNKRNAAALAVYERLGFGRREAVVVDIGGGFVMDDWVMEKRLEKPLAWEGGGAS
jgi:ribosomal protein S18 acetylase RimI-like enzyme